MTLAQHEIRGTLAPLTCGLLRLSIEASPTRYAESFVVYRCDTCRCILQAQAVIPEEQAIIGGESE